MRHLLTILAALLLCAAPAEAQTVKTLSYGTNGRFITGTNVLTFTNSISLAQGDVQISESGMISWAGGDRIEIETYTLYGPWTFDQPAAVRSNLGFVTNLNTLWTATNASNARSAVGLGATWLTNTSVINFQNAIQLGQNNVVTFAGLSVGDLANTNAAENVVWAGDDGGLLVRSSATTRTNLGLGATNIVTFAGITNNGNIRINQTTPTNGLLFVYRTNNEPFLGLANLIASNNTTLSNETLFRVGHAEATNQAAQFGFRVVRTNNGGEGFATFSVFGYNALMMIGPSDRSRTNTATNAGIEADIYTITGSNRVMTLRDTNTGALTLHQDIGFGAGLTNNAPTNTNTPAVWLRVYVGTNNYRLPLYQ